MPYLPDWAGWGLAGLLRDLAEWWSRLSPDFRRFLVGDAPSWAATIIALLALATMVYLYRRSQTRISFPLERWSARHEGSAVIINGVVRIVPAGTSFIITRLVRRFVFDNVTMEGEMTSADVPFNQVIYGAFELSLGFNPSGPAIMIANKVLVEIRIELIDGTKKRARFTLPIAQASVGSVVPQSPR